ncbi:MAG: inorganic phosphate transporter, partial [Nitrospirota bacterium]|nr:inorganic phosphate transporter [Nitrospirota bacterium]
MPETIIIAVILIALLFEISNGWNDSANAIATVVSTRVLTPLQAVLLAAGMNVAGAFISTAVAKTIGKGIVNPSDITQTVV